MTDDERDPFDVDPPLAYRRTGEPIRSVAEWGDEFGKDRHVAVDVFVLGGEIVRVSTVFLVLDHGFAYGGPPMLFETMIFGGPDNGFQDQYSTEEQASAAHAAIVSLYRRGATLSQIAGDEE